MTLKLWLGSLKVIKNDTIQSGTHDLLLMFNITIGLSRTVSEINGDFCRKSPIFPPPVYLTPPLSSPRNWVSSQGSEETWMLGLPDGWKSFKIGLAVLIQYRSVTLTASQPRCRSIYRAYYIAQVKMVTYTINIYHSQINAKIKQSVKEWRVDSNLHIMYLLHLRWEYLLTWSRSKIWRLSQIEWEPCIASAITQFDCLNTLISKPAIKIFAA